MRLKNLCFKQYFSIIIAIIPFISFALGYIVIGKLFQPQTYATPAVVGKRLREAVSILSDHKLNIRFLAQKEEPDIPSNTILSQKPVAGRKIKANQAVYVVVSKKPYKIPCPDLISKHTDEIAKKLNTKNIRNRSYYLPSNYPIDSCIAQYPVASKPIKKNSVITYISQGNQKPVIFPDFKGKPLSKVLDFLENYDNIAVEVVSQNEQNTDYEQENLVICDQRPLAGSIVNIHKTNKLLVHLKTSEKINE